MPDIPDDIHEAATRAYGVGTHEAIAMAILAERQRCADLADGKHGCRALIQKLIMEGRKQ